MKKLTRTISALFAALLLASCAQPTGNNDDNGDSGIKTDETITASWYAYTTNADSTQQQVTYLFFKEDGSIEKAGSSKNEYTGKQFELMQKQLSYSICKKNADGIKITFISCKAPSWAESSGGTDENDDNSEEVKSPYSEYLDCAKDNTQFYPGYEYYWKQVTWPINKNIQLWSSKEYIYKCTCSNNFGFINSNNIFIVGKSMHVGTTTRIIMTDTENTQYCVSVTFTAAENTGSGENNYTPAEGCEWWCFEDANLDDDGKIGPLYCYYNGETCIRSGTNKKELDNSNNYYMSLTKTSAISNFNGTKYKVTDFTKLPAWCFR